MEGRAIPKGHDNIQVWPILYENCKIKNFKKYSKKVFVFLIFLRKIIIIIDTIYSMRQHILAYILSLFQYSRQHKMYRPTVKEPLYLHRFTIQCARFSYNGWCFLNLKVENEWTDDWNHNQEAVFFPISKFFQKTHSKESAFLVNNNESASIYREQLRSLDKDIIFNRIHWQCKLIILEIRVKYVTI